MAIFVVGSMDEPVYSFEVNEYEEEEFGNENESCRILNFGFLDDVYLVKICTENHVIGIELEYAWIENNFPGCERIRQELNTISINGALLPADILTILNQENKSDEKKIVFDISDFFNSDIDEDDTDEEETNSRELRTFEVIIDCDIDNRHLLNIHKIILCSISTLKDNIKQKQPIFVTDGSYFSAYDVDSQFLILL
jgi:hypothetical protein